MALKMSKEQQDYLVSLEQNGRLTPDAVLHDASRPDSPLHDLFEWDNERAAHEYRLEQARAAIRTVEYRIVRNAVTYTAPRYVPDPSKQGRRQGYMALDAVAEDEAATVLAVVAELNRALGSLKRAARIAAVLDQAPEIDNIVIVVEGTRDGLAQGVKDAAEDAA